MEFKKLFRNKKSLLGLLIMPAIMVVFVIYVMNMASESGTGSRIYICDEEGSIDEESLTSENIELIESLPEKINEKDIYIIVGENVEIIYNSANIASSAYYRTLKLARELSVTDGKSEEAYNENYPEIVESDLSTDSEQKIYKYKDLIIFIAMIGIMVSGMFLVTNAAECIAGEKERGIYDSVVLSGRPIYKWVFEKMVFMTTVSFIELTVCFWAGILGLFIFDNDSFADFYAIGTGGNMWIMLLIFSISIIIGPLFVIISSFFNTVKHATSYSSIGVFAVTFLVALPMLSEEKDFIKLPIANFAGIMLNLLQGESVMKPVAFSFATGIIWAVCMLAATVGVLKINTGRNK